MSYRPYRFFISIFTMLIFSFNLTAPIVARADDGTPPPATGSGDEVTPPQDPAPATDPAADNPPAAQSDSSTDTGAVDPAPAADAASDAPAVAEPAADAAPTVETQTVSEVLAQVPDDTDVVVLDDQGAAQPLASQAAAEIIVNGDPMWCPAGAPPGDPSCTSPFSTFNGPSGLLAALAAAPLSYFGNGVIYIADSYVGTQSTPFTNIEGGNVTIDGSPTGGLSALGNLTLQGGWDGVLGPLYTITGTSTFSGISLDIKNWAGSVTIKDIDIDTTNTGLHVNSGGNIVLNNVDAHSSGFYGADLVNTGVGLGTVQVSNSDFSDTGAATTDDGGLRVLSSGDVTLTNVTSNDHVNYGALVQTTGDVSVTGSTFNNQNVTGLFVMSDGDITLNNVTATNNLVTGANLVANTGLASIVSLSNSTFTGNGAAGVYVGSTGAVSLNNVTASTNDGYGAYVDSTYGMGDVTVTNNSTFNGNGVKGLYVNSSGDISLDNVTASNNGSVGAYLEAGYGAGDVLVTNNSIFNGNGDIGLAAMTGGGDITLNNVNVNGTSLINATDIGALLGTYDGGSVNVSNSIFQNMTDDGLLIEAGGPVNLTNVTASNNGSNGVTVENPYACDDVQGIPVTVNGGTFQSNGSYGLYISPGPLGTLTFGTPTTFGTGVTQNGLGNYLLNLVVDCSKHDDEDYPEPPAEKPVNVVELPATDGTPVDQDSEAFSGTELHLPHGTTAKVHCPFNGNSLIEEVTQDGLPSALPLGPDFVSAVSLDLTKGEGDGTEVQDALVTLSFDIPEGMEDQQFSILYWDPAANDGQGDWVELPLAQFGATEFPLHPEDPDDTRMSSGVKVVDGKVTVTVNFPGTFVLVAR